MWKGLFISAILIFLTLYVIIPFVAFKVIHRCESYDTSVTSIHHGLPKPDENGFFIRPQEVCRVFYFPGMGRSVEANYWHLSYLFKVSNCSLVPFQNPGCSNNASITWKDALPFVQKWINPNASNYLMGTSFGSSVATYVRANLKDDEWKVFKGVILENPLPSISQVIVSYVGLSQELMPLVSYIMGENNWAFTQRNVNPFCNDAIWMCVSFDPYSPICNDRKMQEKRYLILHSEKDEIVPYHLSYRMIELFYPYITEHVLLEGANHGDAPAHPRYRSALREYFKK